MIYGASDRCNNLIMSFAVDIHRIEAYRRIWNCVGLTIDFAISRAVLRANLTCDKISAVLIK